MLSMQTKCSRIRRGVFQLTTLEVHLPDLPQEFRDYTMVQLSDFHFGVTTPEGHVAQAVEIVSDIAPNCIFLTGDYLQVVRLHYQRSVARNISPKVAGWTKYRHKARSLAKSLGAELAPLSPPDGIFAILGNHDHTDGPRTIQRYLGEQIKWLINDSAEIKKGADTDDSQPMLKVCGIDDLKRGKPNIYKTLGLQEENISEFEISKNGKPFFQILLSHNPDITMSRLLPPAELGNLILCGHTHGGQICLPFLGPLVCRTKQRNYIKGIKPWENSTVVVSNGIGYSTLALRVFAPPEVVVIKLKEGLTL